MSRLRRIALTDRIFFVTTNLQPGAAPFSPSERTLLLESLAAERRRKLFYLYGYVVMPSHLHLLLDPGDQALSDLLRNYKSKAALSLVNSGTRRGPFWQPRYHDSICRHARNFGDKLEYIHNNPVEARVVTRAEDWLWSSAGWYVNRSRPTVPIDAIDIPDDPDAQLWPAPWR